MNLAYNCHSDTGGSHFARVSYTLQIVSFERNVSVSDGRVI